MGRLRSPKPVCLPGGGGRGLSEKERGKAGKELENALMGWTPAEKC